MVDAGYHCHDTSFGLVAIKSYTGEYTWEEAKTKCSEDGTNGVKAELPNPTGLVDNEWFRNKADELGLGPFWLGINDKGKEGTWETQHGVKQTFFNWIRWGPMGTEEDCVMSDRSRQSNYVNYWESVWHNEKCSRKLELLCTYTERNGEFITISDEYFFFNSTTKNQSQVAVYLSLRVWSTKK